MSPLDLRRPRDELNVNVVGKPVKQVSMPKNKASVKISTESHDPRQTVLQPSSRQVETPLPSPSDTLLEMRAAAREAPDHESAFIDAFFEDRSYVYDRDLGNSKSWKPIDSQEKSLSKPVERIRSERSSPSNTHTLVAKAKATQVQKAFTIPSSQALVDNYPYPHISPFQQGTTAQDEHQDKWKRTIMHSVVINDAASSTATGKAFSTCEKLQILPQDDIDLLSADTIRASMGRKLGSTRTESEIRQDRQKLATDYVATRTKELDEAVEGHVLNNYFVRRTQQEMERTQLPTQSVELQPVNTEQSTSNSQYKSTQGGSSIDRMKKWIETSGSSLAQHFWQDPVEAGAPVEADLQFAKQMLGLAKGRRAMDNISDDLETDLPMCKGLLERLKNDEYRAEHTAFLLRTPKKAVHGVEISKNLKAIRERRLRNTYEATEKQLDSASQVLRNLDAETISRATNAFKRRLGIASRILHKNHTLTRMLTWSAQARLEASGHERGRAELYSQILTRLATLRDTQLALARLLDNAVQTYSVSLKPADEALFRTVSYSDPATVESSTEKHPVLPQSPGIKFLAQTAAAAYLTDEVQTQKIAMQGLSDDGYSRETRKSPRRLFEHRSPLAHSLFRPFNLQFETLGGQTDGETAAENLNDVLQKAGEQTLVREVRSAYEDTNGPITTEHRQASVDGDLSSVASQGSEPFEMPNEDPTYQKTAAPPSECRAENTGEVTELKLSSKETVTESGDSSKNSATHGAGVESPTAILTEIEATYEEPRSKASFVDEGQVVPDIASIPAAKVDNGSVRGMSTHYTILVHDPQTDTLSITTSTSGPPRDASPALPIHRALSVLKAPARFIPHITRGLEVITAKRNMLVLRDALDPASSTRGFETVNIQTPTEPVVESMNDQMNPIDGTPRLSPTGYIGVEQSREQLEQDFDERRQAAAATNTTRSALSKQSTGNRIPRGSVGSVLKTAIWAGAVCYVVGVTAEIFR